MDEDIKEYVENCPYCQKFKDNKLTKNVWYKSRATHQPFQALELDFIGPFKKDS